MDKFVVWKIGYGPSTSENYSWVRIPTENSNQMILISNVHKFSFNLIGII